VEGDVNSWEDFFTTNTVNIKHQKNKDKNIIGCYLLENVLWLQKNIPD